MSKKTGKDPIGDRLKELERSTEMRFDVHKPVYVRIDGRGFSKFTRDMERPFDSKMSMCMIAAAMVLVEKTHARIGYTQSDEISLVYKATEDGDILFNGRLQKLTSVLAGITTAAFINALLKTPGFEHYVDDMPHFDARVFQCSDDLEAVEALIWRERDAAKNSIAMAAQSIHSHRFLQGMSAREQLQALFAAGINYDDYPAYFKRGTWLRRVSYERAFTPEELEAIPEAHRPLPDTLVTRSEVRDLKITNFSRLSNPQGVVFNGEDPRE